MKKTIGMSYLASLGALGVATCCVLPMTMMLLGMGGAWLSVFGQISAFSGYVLGASSLLILTAWFIAYRRKSAAKLAIWLGGASILLVVAWIVFLNETKINDHLITLM